MKREILWILPLAIAFIATVGVWKRKSTRARSRGPYAAKGALCSPTETAFLAALEAALPSNHRAFAQVRLIDVIEPTTKRYADLNRVISKQLDFVICERETLRVLYAIELNDRSHDRAHRRARDAFLAHAMESAGVPLYFFKAAMRYSPDDIRNRLKAPTDTVALPGLIGPRRTQSF